jgi:hypothetical protein
VIFPSLTTLTPVAGVEPKSTAVAPVKPTPVIVTPVPPAAGPESGVTFKTAIDMGATTGLGCDTTKTVESLTPVAVTWAVICCGNACAFEHVPDSAGATEAIVTV